MIFSARDLGFSPESEFRDRTQMQFIALLVRQGASRLILKGGMAMRALYGSTRLTKDVDFDCEDNVSQRSMQSHMTKALTQAARLVGLAGGEIIQTKRSERSARWRIVGTAPGDVNIVWEGATASAGVTLAAGPLTQGGEALDTLLVAGGEGAEAAAENPVLVDWVRQRATRARRIASVCTGAFLLAAAGLLAGMSGRSFSRHYAQATGQTPARAIERLRMEAARRLLSETGAPVKRIAQRCDFGSEETNAPQLSAPAFRHAAILPLSIHVLNFASVQEEMSVPSRASLAEPS